MNQVTTGLLPRLRGRSLLMLLCVACLSRPADGADTAVLRTRLSEPPNDVDTRLQYALSLSREGAIEDAEREARRVLREAPSYLDAHLLLARIFGWQHRFEEALSHVNAVLDAAPAYPGAQQLKLDLLKWMEDYAAVETILRHLISAGQGTADIYYRLAEVERARLQYLLAYRHAEAALRASPTHAAARRLISNTRRVSLQATQELTYFGFDGEEAQSDRYGMALSLASTAFPNARLSATALQTIYYRFRRFNHRAGIQIDLRPRRFIAISLAGQVGGPAEVIPKGTVSLAVRGEMLRILDATYTFTFDVLAWPDDAPARHLRQSLNAGFFVAEQLRLSAGYTLGLLRYCGRPPRLSSSASASASWQGETVTADLNLGYMEEHDPIAIGILPPDTCEEIATLEAASAFGVVRFDVRKIRTLHGGLSLSVPVNRTATLRAGYRLEIKSSDFKVRVLPAHVTHFGLSVWF